MTLWPMRVFRFDHVSSVPPPKRPWTLGEHAARPRFCPCGVFGGVQGAVSAPASTTMVFITGAGSPCCPRLKIDFHQDFERSLPGADLLTEACGVAPTGKGCGQKVADTGDSYYIIRYHREQDCGQGLSSQCFQSAQKSNKGWSSMGNRKRGPFSELLQVRRHRIVLVSLARLALAP